MGRFQFRSSRCSVRGGNAFYARGFKTFRSMDHKDSEQDPPARARAPTFLIFRIMLAIRLLVCNLGVGFCNLRRGAAVRRFHERSRSYGGGVVSFCRPSAVDSQPAFRNMSRTHSFIIFGSIEIIEMKLTTYPVQPIQSTSTARSL